MINSIFPFEELPVEIFVNVILQMKPVEAQKLSPVSKYFHAAVTLANSAIFRYEDKLRSLTGRYFIRQMRNAPRNFRPFPKATPKKLRIKFG